MQTLLVSGLASDLAPRLPGERRELGVLHLGSSPLLGVEGLLEGTEICFWSLKLGHQPPRFETTIGV